MVRSPLPRVGMGLWGVEVLTESASLPPRARYHLRRAAVCAKHLKRADDPQEQARLRSALSHHRAKAAAFSKEPSE